jgi:hypothetical protein
MKTIFESGSYKGHPTVSIWEVDEAGNKVGKMPIVTLGFRKLAAIMANQAAIMEWMRSKVAPSVEGLEL